MNHFRTTKNQMIDMVFAGICKDIMITNEDGHYIKVVTFMAKSSKYEVIMKYGSH